MSLNDYVNRVFSKDGLIVDLGGRYTAEQHEYALSVAECLNCEIGAIDEKILGVLQADTGIGKSLGYLVPCAIYICLTKDFGDKKIIISTYTRHLQKQIFEHDFPFVISLLKRLNLDTSNLSIAYRMGRQAFFSIERTAYITKLLKLNEPKRVNELDSFLDFVMDSCEKGTGLWLDYIEEFGEFPEGIKINDIEIKANDRIDNNAYTAHLNRVKDAAIVISNHHSCIMANRIGMDEFNIHAMIFDESHKIASICFDLFNNRTNLNQIKRYIKKIKEYSNLKGKGNKLLDLIQEIEEEIYLDANVGDLQYISESTHEQVFNSVRNKVLELSKRLSALHKKFIKLCGTDSNSIEENLVILDGDEVLKNLDTWGKENNLYTLSAIGVSAKRRELSLAYLNIYASNLFGVGIKNLTDRIVMTSATMVFGKGDGCFDPFIRQVGLGDITKRIELIVSPKNYANMEFVLIGDDCPSPVLMIDESAEFNETWLNKVCEMIEAASASCKGLLVLTSSYKESEILGKKISHLKPLIHKKNTALKEHIPLFKKGGFILISCAAWEGFNVRKSDNSQLIDNVLITRIPYAPPNPIIDFALKIYGKKSEKTESSLKNLQWTLVVQDVVSKLKQGFGRGTRAPDDSVKVWIADPRMPIGITNKKQGNLVLKNAIPLRFLSNYYDAEIFGKKKEERFYI
jgi:ATP-dependent DNA helicase DinG